MSGRAAFLESRGCMKTTLKTAKTHSVHLTPEASSPPKPSGRLVAHRPLGKVEEDIMYTSPGSVSFLCGSLFFFPYLRCTFVTSDFVLCYCV